MTIRSDDQRKAMFARIKREGGGNTGGRPRPPRPPKPPHSGGGIGGGGGGSGGTPRTPTRPPNRTVLGITIPTTANWVSAVMNSPILGIPGASNMNTWLTSFSNANIPQFNLISPIFGWNPVSWTEWLFEGTLFEKKKNGSGFMWFETSGVNHNNATSANPKQR